MHDVHEVLEGFDVDWTDVSRLSDHYRAAAGKVAETLSQPLPPGQLAVFAQFASSPSAFVEDNADQLHAPGVSYAIFPTARIVTSFVSDDAEFDANVFMVCESQQCADLVMRILNDRLPVCRLENVKSWGKYEEWIYARMCAELPVLSDQDAAQLASMKTGQIAAADMFDQNKLLELTVIAALGELRNGVVPLRGIFA